MNSSSLSRDRRERYRGERECCLGLLALPLGDFDLLRKGDERPLRLLGLLDLLRGERETLENLRAAVERAGLGERDLERRCRGEDDSRLRGDLDRDLERLLDKDDDLLRGDLDFDLLRGDFAFLWGDLDLDFLL